MSRSSKRRPDARAIRPTGTYSIEDLAEALEKSPATVQQWIRDGLPTIDGKEPALVYGWAFREWQEARWEARKTRCAEDEFFCMGCRDRRSAAAGSLASQKTGQGSARIRARCAVCGTTMYKNVSIETAFELHSGTRQLNEEQRLNRSCIAIDSATTSAGAGSDRRTPDETPVPTRGKTSAKRSPNDVPALPANAVNERLKREYFDYLRHSQGLNDKSVRKREAQILRYEAFTGFDHLRSFARERAIAHKRHLLALGLAPATRNAELKGLKHFFEWMVKAEACGVAFSLLDVDYLNPSRAERSMAQAPQAKDFPTVAQALTAFRQMPAGSPVDRRNRAIFALFAETGIRIGALITLRVKHFDPEKGLIRQDSREVATKFHKHILSYLLRIHPEFEAELRAWKNHLAYDLRVGPDAPLFPIQRRGNFGEQPQLTQTPFQTSQAVYNMIKKTFAAAGFRPYSPHRFRDMLVAEMFKRDLCIAASKGLVAKPRPLEAAHDPFCLRADPG